MSQLSQYKKRLFYNDINTPYKDLANLLHESFKERLDSNLNFGCATFSPEELKKQTIDAYIVCYFDEDKPIAMGCLSVRKKLMTQYGAFENLAVSPLPKYRRKGLGGLVLKECVYVSKQLGHSLVTSTTAVDAVSSVKCHLKAGFKIYRLTHNPKRNYVSYCFYYPLKMSLLNLILFLLKKPLVLITKIITK